MAERCSARRERLSTRLCPRGAICGRSHACVGAHRSALTRIILAPPRQKIDQTNVRQVGVAIGASHRANWERHNEVTIIAGLNSTVFVSKGRYFQNVSFTCASQSALIRLTLSGGCPSGRGYEAASRLPRPHRSARGPLQGARSCPVGARGEAVECTLRSSVLRTLSLPRVVRTTKSSCNYLCWRPSRLARTSHRLCRGSARTARCTDCASTAGAVRVALDIKVILTPPCIFH
jgi:hypothetical protein